jgi:hypothetical protein
MLPFIASLAMLVISFTIAAPSSIAAVETRIVADVSGQPQWTVQTPFAKDTIVVNNQATYVIWVTFRDGAGASISNFSVNASTASTAHALPVNTVKMCVAKTAGGTPEDCLLATYYIPTLSEWAMIVFSVVLLGLMTYYVIRRRRLANSVAV